MRIDGFREPVSGVGNLGRPWPQRSIADFVEEKRPAAGRAGVRQARGVLAWFAVTIYKGVVVPEEGWLR